MPANPHSTTAFDELLQDPALKDVFARDPDLRPLLQEKTDLLHLYTNAPPITANSIISSSSAILGMSGMGKTMAVARTIEQLCKVRASLSCIDQEGDLSSIAEMFPNARARRIDRVPTESEMRSMAQQAILRRNQNIFSFPVSLSLDDRRLFVLRYATYLFEATDRLYDMRLQVPHLLILDEAHMFIPQLFNYQEEYVFQLNQKFGDIAGMGRKRGLGLLISSTRMAGLRTTVLAQIRTRWLMRATLKSDIDSYKISLRALQTEGRRIAGYLNGIVPSLNVGQAFFVPDKGKPKIVKFEMRESRHVSKTPTMRDYEKLEGLNEQVFA